MKVILQDNQSFVLRFDADEEVFEGLTKFMKAQQISSCFFSGIGACASVELAFFNPHIKDYRKKPFFEEMEIISLIGNGSLKDGQPAIHAHGMFGRTDFSTIGGHVFKLVVSVTCEVTLNKLQGKLERTNNPDFNLNLLT